jgi:O-acetyl-ADP-ribose deacetylase (regulator of RNase III)
LCLVFFYFFVNKMKTFKKNKISLSFAQAFPAISTGVYSYPIEAATQIAFGEVRKFLETEQGKQACLVLVLGSPQLTGRHALLHHFYTV